VIKLLKPIDIVLDGIVWAWDKYGDALDSFMVNHKKVADFFEWFDDEDTKKAPTAATVGAWNLSNKIFTSRITRNRNLGKVGKPYGRS
jgi:hypothetical protein